MGFISNVEDRDFLEKLDIKVIGSCTRAHGPRGLRRRDRRGAPPAVEGPRKEVV
jgi:hypothetical protein